MYGFHWQAGHAIPHHYFNNEVPVEGKEKIHDYDAEHVNLLHIARAGILNISQPCVPGCEAKSKIPCKSCPLEAPAVADKTCPPRSASRDSATSSTTTRATSSALGPPSVPGGPQTADARTLCSTTLATSSVPPWRMYQKSTGIQGRSHRIRNGCRAIDALCNIFKPCNLFPPPKGVRFAK